MIKNIAIVILIITVFILIYFVYIFYSDKNDLIIRGLEYFGKNTIITTTTRIAKTK